MRETYRALAPLKTGGRSVLRGDLLPEAEDWPYNVREQRLRSRVLEKTVVSDEEFAAHLAKFSSGNEVVEETDESAKVPGEEGSSDEAHMKTEGAVEDVAEAVPSLQVSDIELPEGSDEELPEDEDIEDVEDDEDEEDGVTVPLTFKTKKRIVRKNG